MKKQLIVSKTDNSFPRIEVEYEKEIELFVGSFEGYDETRVTYKILLILEPEAISKFKDVAIKYSNKFDAILTCDDDILCQCPNSHMILLGVTWVHNYKFIDKKFAISNLTGHKEFTEGHMLRKKIHYNQAKIENPIDFYISKFGGVENFNNNKVLGEEKEPLFDSQFHVCIENSQQKNYFTEKIIDCFVSKTVPIYFGAKNIGNFFDIRGILVVNNLNDIINACNSLTEESYNKMSEYIENNFETSKRYGPFIDRLEKIIKEILNTNNITI